MKSPKDICLLGLRMAGMDMHDAATIHHWTKGKQDANDYHINRAHEAFADMAEILGYEIKLKDQCND